MTPIANSLTQEARKRAAWAAARPVADYDSRLIRKDDFGLFIRWSDYGDRNSEYGWEIDHRRATILGGSDRPSNLRALHWRNNASLGGQLSGTRR